jgi:hypothetical protein
MLRDRAWTTVSDELAEAEEQFRSRHWADAVARYYAAVESGLKHRLDEASMAYSSTAALRALSKTASQGSIFPANYQPLFDFLSAIRSPRLHGQGRDVVQIEIGPAEALLAGNHARSLLLYLLQRD